MGTMVEAISISTQGLGGDSEVTFEEKILIYI